MPDDLLIIEADKCLVETDRLRRQSHHLRARAETELERMHRIEAGPDPLIDHRPRRR